MPSVAASKRPPIRNSTFIDPESSMVKKPMTDITRMAAK